MTQPIIALVALVEGPGSVPSIHVVTYITSSRGSKTLI